MSRAQRMMKVMMTLNWALGMKPRVGAKLGPNFESESSSLGTRPNRPLSATTVSLPTRSTGNGHKSTMASRRTLRKPLSADIMIKTVMRDIFPIKMIRIWHLLNCTDLKMSLRCINIAQHVRLGLNDNMKEMKQRLTECVLPQGVPTQSSAPTLRQRTQFRSTSLRFVLPPQIQALMLGYHGACLMNIELRLH